jgi:hypothetical protein
MVQKLFMVGIYGGLGMHCEWVGKERLKNSEQEPTWKLPH